MPDPDRIELSQLLDRVRGGDDAARALVFEHLHAEMRRLADRLLRDERVDHTLQPTALVNEACMRLLGGNADWDDRQHLVRVAARAMRHVLVDHARARRAVKRGGKDMRRVTLCAESSDVPIDVDRIVELHDALAALERFDPQLAQVVEMRFFGGFTEVEVAAAMSISERTVQRSWRTARAWLVRALRDDDGESDGR